MSSRPISLDQSALSPKEYQSYHFFISEFQSFTSPRAGRLRFAEAAQFLRSYFPFETEREDEIRSFFPQKIQLGEIDQGCVLAILRLLSHINNRKSTSRNGHPFQLYRDLIFLQTEPLPSLPQSQPPVSSSSIPLRPVPPPLAATTNPPPSESKSEGDACSQTPLSTKPLPPPKHYSQRVGKPNDGINLQIENLFINQPDIPGSANNQFVPPDSRKIIPKPKILPRLQVNQTQTHVADQNDNVAHHNSAPQVQPLKNIPPTHPNGSRFHESKHVSSSGPYISSSEHTKSVIPPTPPPAKPMRPDRTENIFQQQKIDGVVVPPEIASAPPMTLTRSQTFNHNRRVAPPLPPPRKRRESLHVHNPNSVPLDQLVQLTCNNSDEAEVLNTSVQTNRTPEKSWVNHDKKRSFSNSTAFIQPKTSSNYQEDEDKISKNDGNQKEGKFITTPKDVPPRRSVSLLVQNKPSIPGTRTITAESVTEQLKAIEVGLRQDGKELVKEVKEGWRSRHGKKEERVPLVARKADIFPAATTKLTHSDTNHHAKNNHIHPNHLGNLVSSRWKVSKPTNEDVHLVDSHLDLDEDLDDDDHSEDSLYHHHPFCKPNSWHQLP